MIVSDFLSDRKAKLLLTARSSLSLQSLHHLWQDGCNERPAIGERSLSTLTSAHMTLCMKSLAFSFLLFEIVSALSCSRPPAKRIARAASRTASVEFASPARNGFLASSRRCRPKATASVVEDMSLGMSKGWTVPGVTQAHVDTRSAKKVVPIRKFRDMVRGGQGSLYLLVRPCDMHGQQWLAVMPTSSSYSMHPYDFSARDVRSISKGFASANCGLVVCEGFQDGMSS